jgi:hypothetical protein
MERREAEAQLANTVLNPAVAAAATIERLAFGLLQEGSLAKFVGDLRLGQRAKLMI